MRLSTDYLQLLQSLLPKGRFWTRFLNARLTQYLHAQADELARLDNRAQDICIERSTLSTTELITDHETELGLPDECSPDEVLTLIERRLSANAKLTATGGQNPQYFIDIANKYGYEVIIVEYTPFWCGIGACGDSIGPIENIFVWKIVLFTDQTPIFFECGIGACGDSLQKVSELINTVFCFANKHKPAHTQLLIGLEGFGFSSGFSSGFSAFPSQSVDYLTGGFSQGFSLGFNVNLGGAFSNGFGIGFSKQR